MGSISPHDQTEQAEFLRFQLDFARVLELGVEKLITKNDDDGGVDLNNDGMADEVEDVLEVMWEYHGVLFVVFAYYACLSDSVSQTT